MTEKGDRDGPQPEQVESPSMAGHTPPGEHLAGDVQVPGSSPLTVEGSDPTATGPEPSTPLGYEYGGLHPDAETAIDETKNVEGGSPSRGVSGQDPPSSTPSPQDVRWTTERGLPPSPQEAAETVREALRLFESSDDGSDALFGFDAVTAALAALDTLVKTIEGLEKRADAALALYGMAGVVMVFPKLPTDGPFELVTIEEIDFYIRREA